MFAAWKESYDKLSILHSRDITADRGPYSQSNGFSSSYVQMWELDRKEGWAQKNWHFWTVVLEKILESPSDSKESKPVNPKGNQPWLLIGRTDAEAESPILLPPDAKWQLIGKTPDDGKDCRQRRSRQKRMRWLDSTTDSVDMNLSKHREAMRDRGNRRTAVHGVTKSQTWLSDWTTTQHV